MTTFSYFARTHHVRPLRNKDPAAYRLITIRTQEARLWITPSSEVRRTVGGIIARYQELLGIELYAYCVLGNHYHLLAKAPNSNIDEFCENVNREIARRLNWKHHREGKFWGRRYDDQQVLSDEDLLEALLYICTNPTRHGLVKDSNSWKGLHCIKQVLSEKPRKFSFYHYSAVKDGERVSTHTLRLSILPQFQNVSRNNRRKKISRLLEERMASIALERKEKGQGFLGIEGITGQKPGNPPKNISNSNRPLCYTKNKTLRSNFIRAYLIRKATYRKASILYRLGDVKTKFPEHSFLPPTHRLPRMAPFTSLTTTKLQAVN